MAIIRPFKALRPTKEKAQLVASVPYDVVNRDEAKHFAEGNPLSYYTLQDRKLICRILKMSIQKKFIRKQRKILTE